MQEATSNDEVPFGIALATRVADVLDGGGTVYRGHRDYCGMGLARHGSRYVYDSVQDGYPPAPQPDSFSSSERLEFESRDALVAWLAAQSDRSLSGESLDDPWLRGNQRLRRDWLEEICSWAETDAARRARRDA